MTPDDLLAALRSIEAFEPDPLGGDPYTQIAVHAKWTARDAVKKWEALEACDGCGERVDPASLHRGTSYDGEPRSLCPVCVEPSDPWGPVA